MLTREEREVIEKLIQLTRFTWTMMDNSETITIDAKSDDALLIDMDEAAEVNLYLDELDALPDDQPGVTMGPAAKAEWALRRILK